MSRIPTPATIDAAPAASRPLLEAVTRSLGSAPNMFRLVAVSPATLEGYLGLNGALAKGELDAPTRERIALAVANVNGCTYCNSAHSYIGKRLKLDEAELELNRRGGSGDAKADAAVRFAVRLATQRGRTDEDDLGAVRRAGFSDAAILEIVGHVALNTFTNYVNEAFGTEVDFPVLRAEAA